MKWKRQNRHGLRSFVLFTLVTLVSSFSFGQSIRNPECVRNPQDCFLGRPLFSVPRHAAIFQISQCSRARALVASYCPNPYSTEDGRKSCFHGHAMLCQINCDQDQGWEPSRLDIALDLNSLSRPVRCDQLRAMEEGQEKTRMSEEEFYSKKSELTDRVGLLIETLRDYLRSQAQLGSEVEERKTQRFEANKQIIEIVSGPGGFLETLDHFGFSKTTIRYKNQFFNVQKTALTTFVAAANALDDSGVQDFLALGQELIQEYQNLRSGVQSEFNYTPEKRQTSEL